MAEAGDDDAPSPQAEDFRVEPLNRSHARKAFDCGVDTLNRYLQTQARQDAKRYAAASFVAVHARTPERIVGYYTLAPTGIDLSDVPDETARTLPRYPIVPAILIGRLAVDRGFRSCGYGEALLMDAMDRALSKASEIGRASCRERV